jgi:predicted nucleic acid-binding protein
MMEIIYFDTSALAKWYLNEESSDEVEQYLHEHGPVAISDLTVVEMRSLLARRRRERAIDSKLEARIFAVFKEDIRQGFLICHPLPDGLMDSAVDLISAFPDVLLRTLDALHLVIAKRIGADVIATADRVMSDGAVAMGFSVMAFTPRRSR